MIFINGSNLEPKLEAFMYHLLDEIQARENAWLLDEKMVIKDGDHDQAMTADAADIVGALIELSDDERKLIFSYFCTHCGSNNPECQCWNDE